MKHSQAESRRWVDLATLCTSYGFDALVLLAYLVVIDLVVLGTSVPPALRAALAIPFVLFLPGYAVTAALFPRGVDTLRTDERHRPFEDATAGALRTSERVALSFGVSLVVLPALGVVHSVAGIGFSTPSLLGTLNAVILLGLGVGLVRRFQAPRRERLSFAPGTWSTRAKTRLASGTRADTVLTVALIAGVVVATGSLGFALVAPGDGESYTTVKLLTENESGDLVTDGYPESLSSGESASLVLGVENHEHAQTDYTVVTEVQSVRADDGSLRVDEERELDRRSQTVAAGETWYSEQSVAPGLTGEDVRVVFLVYRGEAPDDATRANAYRYVDLSIDVTSE